MRGTKLSKKSQEKQDEIQKTLYESNRWWNDWVFQLRWNNLEWVDPKSNPKIVKPFSVSSEEKNSFCWPFEIKRTRYKQFFRKEKRWMKKWKLN